MLEEEATEKPAAPATESAPAEPGLLDRLKKQVNESERVQKGLEYVQEKAKVIAESEKVQKGVEWTKEKATAVMESEKVQKGVAYGKEKVAVVAAKGQQVGQQAVAAGQQVLESERVQKGVEYAKQTAQQVAESEKVKRGLEMAGDASQAVKEQTQVVVETAQKGAVQAKTMWTSGKGEISRAKEVLKTGAWRGKAAETLDIQKREEWQRVKVKGSEEVTISARSEYTTSYFVKAGHKIMWTFRVQSLDVNFVLRRRVMKEIGGSMEEDLLPPEKYDDTETCTGSWVAEEDTNVILAFDNSYSVMRSKTVAYLVGVESPEPEAPAASLPAEPPAVPPTGYPSEAAPAGPHI